MHQQWVFMRDMDGLLVSHACAGSEWRGQCEGDAAWYGDDDVVCFPPAACGVARSRAVPVRE
jgi:hypothetical protein